MNIENRTIDGRRLKACHYNGLTYLIFADDWPALNYPAEWQFDSLRDAPPVGRCTDFSGEEFKVIRKLFALSPKTVLADVGSNYGREAIRYALFRRSLGISPDPRPAVLAFEPGPVRLAAEMNLRLHGVDEVTLYPFAVSDTAGVSSFWTLPCNSLGSAMNIEQHPDAVPVTVKSVAISKILNQEGADGPLFLKVDTQGYEPKVWAGLSDYAKDHPVCGIFEFSPKLMKKTGRAIDFLCSLLDRALVIDMGPRRDRRDPIKHDNAAAFVNDIADQRPDYTDLMVIDSRLTL